MVRTVILALIGWMLTAPLAAQPPRPPETRPITFEIRVPAEAVIEIEGVKTRTTGETRQFKTPDMPLGRRYGYTVKVTFEGKTTTHQLVMSHAGPNVLDLRKELTAGKPAPPRSDGTFTLFAPRNMILKPGGDAAPLAITIKRERVTEPVEVTFKGLPPGVKINDATIATGKEEQSALAVSDKDAKPGVSTVEVVAKAGQVQKRATFQLTVAGLATAPPPRTEAGKPDDKPKAPPADLPTDPPPVPPGTKKPDAPKPGDTKKPEDKPKAPPADLPDDPPPRPPAPETKKPAEKK